MQDAAVLLQVFEEDAARKIILVFFATIKDRLALRIVPPSTIDSLTLTPSLTVTFRPIVTFGPS